jgi:hypothetical protein
MMLHVAAPSTSAAHQARGGGLSAEQQAFLRGFLAALDSRGYRLEPLPAAWRPPFSEAQIQRFNELLAAGCDGPREAQMRPKNQQGRH